MKRSTGFYRKQTIAMNCSWEHVLKCNVAKLVEISLARTKSKIKINSPRCIAKTMLCCELLSDSFRINFILKHVMSIALNMWMRHH